MVRLRAGESVPAFAGDDFKPSSNPSWHRSDSIRAARSQSRLWVHARRIVRSEGVACAPACVTGCHAAKAHHQDGMMILNDPPTAAVRIAAGFIAPARTATDHSKSGRLMAGHVSIYGYKSIHIDTMNAP